VYDFPHVQTTEPHSTCAHGGLTRRLWQAHPYSDFRHAYPVRTHGDRNRDAVLAAYRHTHAGAADRHAHTGGLTDSNSHVRAGHSA